MKRALTWLKARLGWSLLVFLGAGALLLWLLPALPVRTQVWATRLGYHVAVSPAGDRIARKAEQTIEVVNLTAHDPVLTLRCESGEQFGYPMRFSQDGRTLAAWTHHDQQAERYRLYVWECQTGRLMTRLVNVVNTFELSPDGRRVAVVDDREGLRSLTIYATDTGQVLLRVPGSDWRYVATVAWSPDGRRLVTSSIESSVQIWDSTTGEVLHTLPHLFGGSRYYVQVAFSEDGRFVIGRTPEVLSLWEAATGEVRWHVEVPGSGYYPLGEREGRLVFCRRVRVAWPDWLLERYDTSMPAWCVRWLRMESGRFDCVSVDLATGGYRRVLTIPRGHVPVGRVKGADGRHELVTCFSDGESEWSLAWWAVPGSLPWLRALGWALVVTLFIAAVAACRRRRRIV